MITMKKFENMGDFARHGDLTQTLVESIPKSAKPIESRTLAEGEATGHKHMLRGQAVILEDPETQTKYIKVEGRTQVIHEEHNAIELEPGLYKLEYEREHDYLENNIRRVMD